MDVLHIFRIIQNVVILENALEIINKINYPNLSLHNVAQQQ